MCKTCKKSLLDVENAILIRYYYYKARTRALYESTDGPAGQPADNPPNSDRLWDVHRTVPELMVPVHWGPGQPIWKRVGSDLYPDPKRRSGTVAIGALDPGTENHPSSSTSHHPSISGRNRNLTTILIWTTALCCNYSPATNPLWLRPISGCGPVDSCYLFPPCT